MKFFYWLGAILAFAVVAWVSITNKTQQFETDSEHTQRSQNVSTLSDRDSAAEEVRAVATKIANLEQSIEEQRVKNKVERETLRSEFVKMLEDIHLSLVSMSEKISNNQEDFKIESISRRLDELEMRNNLQTVDNVPQTLEYPKIIWHYSDEELNLDQSANAFQHPVDSLTELVNQASLVEAAEETAIPHYTIPPTTTLLNATALTALVGRIPIRGSLQDPWRFKIIIGAKNLAANGHTIPGLSGMLVAGTARGDMTLSCVSGNIDTATFIFADGTIQTTKKPIDTDSTFSGIGWISDDYGNPCIPGELKSNALKFLTQSTLVSSIGATASALSNAQTQTRTVGATGDKIESLVGDIDNFIAGYAVSESLSGVSRWLAERQLDSFDAVYIPAGLPVAIHIEDPVLINYSPNARKVNNFDNVGK